MSLLTRKRWIAAKIETTKGTAETLAAGDAKILAFDPEINQEMEFEDRAPAGLTMGRLESIRGPHVGKATIKVELKGSGTGGVLPVWAQTLLIASGMSAGTGGVCSLVSSLADQKTITLGVWEDGLFKSLAGAMCNAVIEGEFGKKQHITFDVMGVWQTPVDAAAPSITHETTKPIRLAGADFTVGGSASRISRYRFDFGNDIQLRPWIENDSALLHAYLADRNPRIDFDPEAELVATEDIFGTFIAGTTAALALDVGSTAGNTIELDCPRLQYVNPREGNRNGLMTHEIQGQMVAANGDDEFTITFA